MVYYCEYLFCCWAKWVSCMVTSAKWRGMKLFLHSKKRSSPFWLLQMLQVEFLNLAGLIILLIHIYHSLAVDLKIINIVKNTVILNWAEFSVCNYLYIASIARFRIALVDWKSMKKEDNPVEKLGSCIIAVPHVTLQLEAWTSHTYAQLSTMMSPGTSTHIPTELVELAEQVRPSVHDCIAKADWGKLCWCIYDISSYLSMSAY